VQIDFDRGTNNHTRNWYDKNWERAPFYWASLLKGTETVPNNMSVSAPTMLSKFIDLSELLSQNFPYVRIDFYYVSGKIYFGEITFYHDNGFRPVVPNEWDRKLGDLIKLPI